MSQIYFENVCKSFYISKGVEGSFGAIKSFFSKEKEEVKALKGMSFEIDKGELVGYIGPNGAGKSTTVKIMSGILTPTEGTCRINGLVPWKERQEHVKNLGVVFGQRSQLWWDLPVRDSFNLLKDIYMVPQNEYKKMLEDLITELQLGDFLNTPVRQLSLGQRMRCELAASLLHNPPILFLDEPTIGLDAVSKSAVRKFIKKVNEKYQTTVILTTHDMDDIEAICNRIIIIGKGEKLFDGTLAELRAEITNERILIVDYGKNYHQPLVEGLRIVDEDYIKDDVKMKVSYRFNPTKHKVSELIRSLSVNYEVEDVLVENISIEEIIKNVYEVHNI